MKLATRGLAQRVYLNVDQLLDRILDSEARVRHHGQPPTVMLTSCWKAHGKKMTQAVPQSPLRRLRESTTKKCRAAMKPAADSGSV